MQHATAVAEILIAVTAFISDNEMDFNEYGKGDFRRLIQDFKENGYEWTEEAVESGINVLMRNPPEAA